MKKAKLILLRHGESLFNQENLFTGWTDIELSDRGIQEAKEAGKILKKYDLYPDISFTSWLKRSIHTTQLALKTMHWEHIDSLRSWKLNERHYGAWQKQDKARIEKEVGEKTFLSIRRGYASPPPPMVAANFEALKHDLKYRNIDASLLPHSESLKDTGVRTLHYFKEAIVPELARGRTVLVSAHGNSLRALVMEIEALTPEEIVNVEIPTGKPILYTFDAALQMLQKEYLE